MYKNTLNVLLLAILFVTSTLSFADSKSKKQEIQSFKELQTSFKLVSDEDFSKSFGYIPDNNLSIHNLERVLTIVRHIFTQPSKIKIISKVFEDLLILDPASIEKVEAGKLAAPIPFKVWTKAEHKLVREGQKIDGISFTSYKEKKILSEARFIKLLRRSPRMWKDLENFLEANPRESADLLERKKNLINWRRNFQDLKYEKEHLKSHVLKELRHDVKKAQKQYAKLKTPEAQLVAEQVKLELEKQIARLKELEKELNEVRPLGKEIEAEYKKKWDELRKVDDPLFKEQFAQRLKSSLKTSEHINAFIKDNKDDKSVLLYMSKADQQKGIRGYKLVDFRATTPLVFPDGSIEEPRSIEEMWVEFIDKARRTVSINIYEWDLPSIKDALIRAHERGVKVRASFDLKAMQHYPERMELYYELREYVRSKKGNLDGSFHLSLIDSISRNHQKMGARDHESRRYAAVIYSSANASRSGMSGDLAASELSHDRAIANGNHAYVLESYPLANITEHNLKKTQEFGLRGTSGINAYPKSGSFLVRGSTGGYFIIAFTPNGGDGDIHSSMTARSIEKSHGLMRTLQFSASSQTVVDAMYERAKKERKAGANWRFQAIGDGSSFLSSWSIFLKIAGLNRVPKNQQKTLRLKFQKDPESMWRKALGRDFKRIMSEIRTAPSDYGMFYVKDKNGETLRDPETGKAILISAKLHHKTIIPGIARYERKTGKPIYVVVDGSANATDSSLKNQEFHIVAVDRDISRYMDALFRGIWNETDVKNGGILKIAEKENKDFLEELGEKIARQSKRNQKSIKVNSENTGGICPVAFKSSK